MRTKPIHPGQALAAGRPARPEGAFIAHKKLGCAQRLQPPRWNGQVRPIPHAGVRPHFARTSTPCTGGGGPPRRSRGHFESWPAGSRRCQALGSLPDRALAHLAGGPGGRTTARPPCPRSPPSGFPTASRPAPPGAAAPDAELQPPPLPPAPRGPLRPRPEPPRSGTHRAAGPEPRAHSPLRLATNPNGLRESRLERPVPIGPALPCLARPGPPSRAAPKSRSPTQRGTWAKPSPAGAAIQTPGGSSTNGERADG